MSIVKKFFIYKNGIYFCEENVGNSAFFFNAHVYLAIFFIGERTLYAHTDKGLYKIHLKRVNFTIFNHIDNWWISGVPYTKLEKGDL